MFCNAGYSRVSAVIFSKWTRNVLEYIQWPCQLSQSHIVSGNNLQDQMILCYLYACTCFSKPFRSRLLLLSSLLVVMPSDGSVICFAQICKDSCMFPSSMLFLNSLKIRRIARTCTLIYGLKMSNVSSNQSKHQMVFCNGCVPYTFA